MRLVFDNEKVRQNSWPVFLDGPLGVPANLLKGVLAHDGEVVITSVAAGYMKFENGGTFRMQEYRKGIRTEDMLKAAE